MPTPKKRRAFETGHRRKFLVVVDDTPEVDSAVFFAASRIGHTGGMLTMLYVVEPIAFQHWAGVRDVRLEEETSKARALFRLFRRKLNEQGFEAVETEEITREGVKAEEIISVIEDDEDISILVLGASSDAKLGPGPLVATLAAGSAAGSFPIPISVVPGTLTIEDLKSLA